MWNVLKHSLQSLRLRPLPNFLNPLDKLQNCQGSTVSSQQIFSVNILPSRRLGWASPGVFLIGFQGGEVGKPTAGNFLGSFLG